MALPHLPEAAAHENTTGRTVASPENYQNHYNLREFMYNTAITPKIIQVEHVTIRSTMPFTEVKANLEHRVPKVNEEIGKLRATGETERLKQLLEDGPELSIFLFRDHGGLLRIIGRPSKAVQYEIGNRSLRQR